MGGRIGGGRCSGSLKIGTIIIQGGQRTAGVGGEDKWREVSWYHKKWNHYNSRRTANCRGRGEDRWWEVSWYHKKWNHYNSRRTANCRGWGGRIGGGRCPGIIKSGTIIIQGGQLTAGGGGEDRWREVFWYHKKWNHYNSRRTANYRGWGGG